MLLKNISALLGEELDFVSDVDIEIKNNKFQKIQPEIKSTLENDIVDCQGLLLIPGFINAHTHIADSIGKDITINSTVNQKIHPMFGIKSKILKNTSGLDGSVLLIKVSSDIPIRSIILGRLDFHQNSSEIKKNNPFPKEKIQDLPSLVKTCDGIGISGANEHSTSVLTSYSKTKKLRAIHSSETRESVRKSKQLTGQSETIRALSMKPDFLIHMTHASKSDLQAA
ncbi:MAG: cytosine deaminase, partial [Nitrosopumilus sp.]